MIAKVEKAITWKRVAPYLLIAVVVIGIAFWGSRGKGTTDTGSMNMQTIAKDNYAATADQVSEFYIVSELASAMDLPTAEAVNVNYNSLNTARNIGQTTSVEKLEKPTIVDTSNLARGVINYTVANGDTLQSIADKYGVTTTQIRWSNGLKNDTITVGQSLAIPGVPGIVYTVKANDTIQSIAEKYKSTTDSIISANDLEKNTDLAVGTVIIIPSGQLPETERPEYVRTTTTTTTSSSYSTRTYWTSSNPMPWGWCTWYAWARRSQMGANYVLPGGLGNANTWDNSLSGTFRIDHTPSVGAVLQTDAGWYGHVGIVDAVNADGSITFSDMNGISGWGRVGSKTISAAEASQYKYIHERK